MRTKKPRLFNTEMVREFLTNEITRLTGLQWRTDTILEYREALELLARFQGTDAGIAFNNEELGSMDARFIYDQFKSAAKASKIL